MRFPFRGARAIHPSFKGEQTMNNKTLYERLGGYDAIGATSEDLSGRLMSDSRLRRFWDNRGVDDIKREKQLVTDFLCAIAGGPHVLHRSRYEDIS
jgi:truncated hemoglobin YjbI